MHPLRLNVQCHSNVQYLSQKNALNMHSIICLFQYRNFVRTPGIFFRTIIFFVQLSMTNMHFSKIAFKNFLINFFLETRYDQRTEDKERDKQSEKE